MAKKTTSKGKSKALEAVMGDRPERPKNLKIVSGGKYHNFKTNPVFQGTFLEVVKAKEDVKKYKTKKGDVIAFKMLEHGTGNEKLLSNSQSIAEAFEGDKFNKKTLWWIEFIEKRQLKGKSWNEFVIGKQE